MAQRFDRVLIANRGEIAVRIARACHELGLSTVGVCAEADRDAYHTRAMDQVWRIAPADPRDHRAASTGAYLDIPAIIDIARRAGAGAIHPGYGFLAENADFAAACAAAGIVFVGPPAAAMRALGDKINAKQLMIAIGAPVVPGWIGDADDLDDVERAIEALELPIIIKAAAGGGGRGMRVVRHRDELRAALASARREAISAFGDGRLFIEKLIENARHIEVQVLADQHGTVIHLGERECSVQRRHQKIIEEAPSPVVDAALRAAMGDVAVKAASKVGYVGAGTVEFLLGGDGDWHFLEMNTRLQVEHPVTEMVTGLDLVQLQIRIAQGEPLPLRQTDVALNGHAIECRICAEDPNHGYAPSVGRLRVFRPPAGRGIRNDVGVAVGDEVTTDFDPMIAKLIMHGPDRATALARTSRALGDYAIIGPQTNLPLLQAIINELLQPAPAFGAISTAWLDQHGARLIVDPYAAPAEATWLAALLADLWRDRPANPQVSAGHADRQTTMGADWRDPWTAGAWRDSATWREVTLRATPGDAVRSFRVKPVEAAQPAIHTGQPATAHQRWSIATAAGTELHTVVADPTGAPVAIVSGDAQRRWPLCAHDDDAVVIVDRGVQWQFERVATNAPLDARAEATASGSRTDVTAPLPGRIVNVAVAVGDHIRAGQTLLTLEAMKMEHAVLAPRDGVIERLTVAVGAMTRRGDVLIEIG